MEQRSRTIANIHIIYLVGYMNNKKNNKKRVNRPCRQLHKLRHYKKIQDLTKEHYEPGESILVRVFLKHIYPIYPMSYSQFRRILEEPALNARIAELEEQEEKKGQKE